MLLISDKFMHKTKIMQNIIDIFWLFLIIKSFWNFAQSMAV